MVPTMFDAVNQLKTNLDKIQGGIAGNKVEILAEGEVLTVSGFIVKRAGTKDTVHVSCAWGSSKSLESLSMDFKIDLENRKLKITAHELRAKETRSATFLDSAAHSFLVLMLPRLSTKVRRKLSGQTGGSPNKSGARLEAWPATRKAPKDVFDSVRNIKFTDTFIDIARSSNVTYK